MRVTSISPSSASTVADTLGGRPTDRARDHDDLRTVQLTLDDVAEHLGIGVHDSDTVHLRARVTARRGQREGVDVVHLAVARRAGDVDEFTAHAHHRQSRLRMHEDTVAPDRGQQPHLCGADDRARPHRDVTRLDVVARPTDIRSGAHTAQHRHARLTAVGPSQRKHGVGECRHRRACLNPCRLLGLQPAGGARTGLNRAHHRQAHLTVGASLGLFGAVVLITDTDAQHVHAADGVAVDGGLIESRQGALGDDFLCAHQTLRLGDRDPDGSGSHRGGRYSSLLLLNRPHHTPF